MRVPLPKAEGRSAVVKGCRAGTVPATYSERLRFSPVWMYFSAHAMIKEFAGNHWWEWEDGNSPAGLS